MNRLCELAGVSRAGYYRFRRRRPPGADRMDLRNEIQQIALHWPAYGYRRIHGELVRGGWTVNHKCVLRLMRIDNLLCVRRRKFILTTDSGHSLPIYPQFSQRLGLEQYRSALGSRHHLYPLATLVCLSRSLAGRLLPALHRLGVTARPGSGPGARSLTHGARATQAQARPGASLRSRCAIGFARLHHAAGTARYPYQHEPHRCPL